MKARSRSLPHLVLLAVVLLAAAAQANSQTAYTATTAAPIVPQVVRYSGTAQDKSGVTAQIVFKFYASAEGGDALWSESQRISVGRDGSYSVLLGSETETGLPQTVFAAGQARWLGISIEGGAEQPRVPLTSVAYAMKAADAETLAGVPASEFVTQSQIQSRRQVDAAGNAVRAEVSPSGTGVAGQLALWTDASTLSNSGITVTGQPQSSVAVGINTAEPIASLDVNGDTNFRGAVDLGQNQAATTASGVNSPPLVFVTSTYKKSAGPQLNAFEWAAVPTGNNTATPASTLQLSYLTGATLAATGLSIAPTGVITFAPGQSFPGAGAITGVSAASPLTGGGSSGAISLGLNLSALETSLNSTYAQLGAANVFSKPVTFAAGQTFPGTLTALTASAPLAATTTKGAVTLSLNTATLETTLNSKYAQLAAANTFSKPITFATGQTFPGTGKGTITAVNSTSPLTGGGNSGSVELGLDLTKLEGELNAVYPQLSASNTFTDNQTVMGSFVATGSVTGQGTVAGGGSVSGINASGTSNAAGVNGYEAAQTGEVHGVQGSAVSTTAGAAGLNGYEGASTGQVYGATGSTNSVGPYASGVNGYEGASTGVVYGVSGSTASATSGAAGVIGNENATTGAVNGVYGSSNSATANASGVSGYEAAESGQVYGVNGSTNSTGNGAAGVNGYEGATTGLVYGVSGGVQSPNAIGVLGTNNSATGPAVGVLGTSISPNGYGTQGSSPNVALAGLNQSCGASGCKLASGIAGQFYTGVGGTLLQGLSGATFDSLTAVFSVDGTGKAYFNGGVSSAINSTTNNVILAINNATTGTPAPVDGITYSSAAAGVGGFNYSASGGTGVYGESNSASGVGVFGANMKGGLAGRFTGTVQVNGDLNVTGKMTKGSGSFKIDHPLDPSNKYLSHSFVESPDMMNVYNGNITTDRHGLATVVLPDYFQALNRDFRYQLTVIGQFAQAIVAQEIDKNHFVIRTNKPNVKVSWQVTGIRQDAYANANRIPVEEDKPENEQGYYLHPEAFGQSPSKGIGAAVVANRKPLSSTAGASR